MRKPEMQKSEMQKSEMQKSEMQKSEMQSRAVRLYTAAMAHFFARLTPKRSDFPTDMSPEEGAAMAGHFAFLAEQLANGALVVAGPVMSPGGTFGMAVLESPSIDAAEELLARDPANAIGSYEVSPMGSAVARPRS